MSILLFPIQSEEKTKLDKLSSTSFFRVIIIPKKKPAI